MIRFTRAQHGSDTVVRIAGRLQAAHLANLDVECRDPGGTLVLDLSELQGADAESVRRLLALAEGGARITGPSPYISLLLEKAREGSAKLPQRTNP